jgi:Asp-tRNA(Asn)/Glu-tRNA(Gln) amidotransferase A subunit family amidase
MCLLLRRAVSNEATGAMAARAARKVSERDAARHRMASEGLGWLGLLSWAQAAAVTVPPNVVVQLSADPLLNMIRLGRLSCEYVMRCFIGRAMAAGAALGCNAEENFAAALAEAVECDRERAAGRVRGPLHGLPISIKDQINMKGFDSTLGLACRVGSPAQEDAVLVQALRQAGAIPFVRTAVPQLLMAPETFSFWGLTLNPWNLGRSAGGSSGGEAALLAACGSPVGMGTDVAGSIRIPASYCGICGFKPTNGRLSMKGVAVPRRERANGQKEISPSAGPMARCVGDLELIMRVLCSPVQPHASSPPPGTTGGGGPVIDVSSGRAVLTMHALDGTLPPLTWDTDAYHAATGIARSAAPQQASNLQGSSQQTSGQASVRGASVKQASDPHASDMQASDQPATAPPPRKLRVGVLLDDGWFEPAPACARAVHEAAAALRSAGHTLVDFPAGDDLRQAVLAYIGLASADGRFRSFVEALEGEELHPNYSFLHRTAQIPNWVRPVAAAGLRAAGETRKALLVEAAREKSAYEFWQVTVERDKLKELFLDRWRQVGVDVLLCPANGLPALPHGQSVLLAQACSYDFVFNAFNLPAGTVNVTAVKEDEQRYSPKRDVTDSFCAAARNACVGSAGLPVSVQMVGLPWKDETTLGAMRALEHALDKHGAGEARASLPPYPPLMPAGNRGRA